MKKSKHVIVAERGLLDKQVWQQKLQDYDTALLMKIRNEIVSALPGVIEKFNQKQKYFGYRFGDSADTAYIYVQKKRYVIDLRISPQMADSLLKEGFQIKYRNNFQGRNGWLTGWQVPLDYKDYEKITKRLILSLK
jgi:hypothetical protein